MREWELLPAGPGGGGEGRGLRGTEGSTEAFDSPEQGAVNTGRFPIPAPAAAGWAFQMQSPENTVGVTGPYSGQQTRNGVTGHPRGSS